MVVSSVLYFFVQDKIQYKKEAIKPLNIVFSNYVFTPNAQPAPLLFLSSFLL